MLKIVVVSIVVVSIVVVSILFLSSAFPLHQAMGQPTATPSVQLTTTSVLNQGTFSTNVTVSNVTDLYGWQVSLYYNSAVLNGTRVDEGPFLKADGAGTYFIVSNFTDNYNATQGYILVACTRLGNVAGVNGSGTLATLTFKAVGTGSDVLQFDTTGRFSTELDDPNGNSMPFTTIDEFPALAILPLFMIATLVSLVTFRKRKMTRAKPKQ